jgi:hypothetical protein
MGLRERERGQVVARKGYPQPARILSRFCQAFQVERGIKLAISSCWEFDAAVIAPRERKVRVRTCIVAVLLEENDE